MTPDPGLSHQFFLQVDVPEGENDAIPEAVLVIAAQAAIGDAFKEGYGVRPRVTILALNEVNDS